MKLRVLVSALMMGSVSLASVGEDECLKPTPLVVNWLQRKELDACSKLCSLARGESLHIPVSTRVGDGSQETQGSFIITKGSSDEMIVETDMTITEVFHPNESVEEIEQQMRMLPPEAFEQQDECTTCRNHCRAHYDKGENRLTSSSHSKCVTRISLAELVRRIETQER